MWHSGSDSSSLWSRASSPAPKATKAGDGFSDSSSDTDPLNHISIDRHDHHGEDKLCVDFVIVPSIHWRRPTDYDENFGSGTSKWVTDYMDTSTTNSRLLRYHYDPSRVFRGGRSRESIHQLALELLGHLAALRQKASRKRLIYFIAHDIGGTIVKDALTTAALDLSSWRDISEMARVAVFMGSPHGALCNREMNDRLTRFLYSTSNKLACQHLPEASSIPGLTQAIIEINGLFIDSKVPIQSWIISLYSGKTEESGEMHPVLDVHFAALGIPLAKRIPVHSADDYRSLRDYLDELGKTLKTPITDAQLRHGHHMLSLSSPVYPLSTEKIEVLVPFTYRDAFNSWRQHPGPRILNIRSSHHVRSLEQLFYYLENETQNEKRRRFVLYFSFNHRDVRRDSITDMVSTFLAQIINHYPQLTDTIDALPTEFTRESEWAEVSLLKLFHLFSTINNFAHVVLLLDHFDKCSEASLAAFLESFVNASEVAEIPLKAVISTQRPFTRVFPDLPCLAIDMRWWDWENAKDGMYDAIWELNEDRPDLTPEDGRVRQQIEQLWDQKLDPLARQIIWEQLRLLTLWPVDASLEELFDAWDFDKILGESQETQVAKTLDMVLRRVPDQFLLGEILVWLLYSVRPLTVWELATAVCFQPSCLCGGVAPKQPRVDEFVSTIQTSLAGVVYIDQNEVRFRHTEFHDIMIDERSESGEGYLWERFNETAHTHIRSVCVSYLSIPSVRELMDKTFRVPDPDRYETPALSRENFASYAIQAWAHHFSLASRRPDLTWTLAQNCLVESLARSHWCLAKGTTKGMTPPETLFPIFACLGICDVVKPRDEADAFRGLLEAASKGHAEVIGQVLEDWDFSEKQLLEAVAAACLSGDEYMALGLLDTIVSRSLDPTSIPWPGVLLHRAASLGQDRLADKALMLGCPVDPTTSWKPPGGCSPLLQAAENGHTKTVRVLLKHGANVNSVDDSGRNPLHAAAACGRAEVIKILVEEGKMDIEGVYSPGRTALWIASVWGNHKAVEELLRLGAKPDMGVSHLREPLDFAASRGFPKCTKLLLDAGANVDSLDQGWTPLQRAAVGGHMAIVEMLLDKGADPGSELNRWPLLIAVVAGFFGQTWEQVRMLKRVLRLRLDRDVKDQDGKPLLHWAVQSGNGNELHARRLVKMILRRGYIDINATDADGHTALLVAIISSRPKMVRLLLKQKGIDVNKSTTRGMSPLCYAVRQPEPAIARLLLRNGADPNVGRDTGFIPLVYAACFNRHETVELLLEYGASTELAHDVSSNAGLTAMAFAADAGGEKAIRLLAEAGADLMKKDAKGTPVLHHAVKGPQLQVLLEYALRIDVNQRDGKGRTALHLGGDLSLERFRRLVNAGADMEARAEDGSTPLAMAAGEGKADIVEYLLKKGVNLDTASTLGGSPLHMACQKGSLRAVELLVEHGADVNQTCITVGTPLQAACGPLKLDMMRTSKDLEPMIECLVGHGIQPRHPHRPRSADVTIQSGLLGFPINAASLYRTTHIIHLIFRQPGATVQVRDDFGRTPIHLAALNGIDNFDAILAKGGLLTATDKMGRTPLHYAAQAGRVQVVEEILRLLPRADVDVADVDGWTPLCWAARGPWSILDVSQCSVSEDEEQMEVLELLLKRGADRTVKARVGDQTWTPLRIARFNGESGAAVKLLKRGVDDFKSGRAAEESDDADELEEYKSEKGLLHKDMACDACLSVIRGLLYHCTTCGLVDLCWKCRPHAELFHPPDHEYEVRGPEFEVRAVDAGRESSSSSTESSDWPSSDSE